GVVNLFFEGGIGHIPDDGTAIEIQYNSSGILSIWEPVGIGDDPPPQSTFSDILQHPVKPGTFNLNWTDGIPNQAVDDGFGNINDIVSGDLIGTVNYATGDLALQFRNLPAFNHTPDDGTSINSNYTLHGAAPISVSIGQGYRPGDTFSKTLTETPILAGATELQWQYSGHERKATDKFSNSLLYDTVTDIVVGNINYNTGKVNLDFGVGTPTTPDAGTPININYTSAKPAKDETYGTYTFLIDIDGKQVALDLDAEKNGGDTMEEVIRKFNEAFSINELDVRASLDTNPSETEGSSPAIVFTSKNYGSAHDIKINVINRPAGGPYAEESYNRPEGIGFGIYNSDRTNAFGILNCSTKLVTLPQVDKESKVYDTLFGSEAINSSINIIDKSGRALRIDFNAMLDINGDSEITIDEFINKINMENDLGNIDLKAVFSELEGKIQLYSTDPTSTGKISVLGSEDTDLNNQLAVRLGIYGIHDSNFVIGERITSTRDIHLSVSGGNFEQEKNIFAKFGSKTTMFSDQIDESGNASVQGLEFRLQDKMLKKYEKFDISVQNEGFRVNSGNFDDKVTDLAIKFGTLTSKSLGLANIDVTTQNKAIELIDSGKLDQVIDDISSRRAKIGAFSNRLQMAVGTVEIARENLSDAESRIRDADIAQETMVTVRETLKSQSSVAMMSRATESMQLVLTLLQSI
ncbi:hypothetical protein KAJ27_16395, partial [bacterium]|nr:hypothetical protein [bacterium]